jgi:hypothetical protein
MGSKEADMKNKTDFAGKILLTSGALALLAGAAALIYKSEKKRRKNEEASSGREAEAQPYDYYDNYSNNYCKNHNDEEEYCFEMED